MRPVEKGRLLPAGRPAGGPHVISLRVQVFAKAWVETFTSPRVETLASPHMREGHKNETCARDAVWVEMLASPSRHQVVEVSGRFAPVREW